MIGDNNGSPVYETPTPQSNYDLHYASDNYLYVAYSDMRNFIDSDIYIQKYSEEGTSQLSDVLVVDNFLADAVFPDAAGPSISICKLSIIMIRLYITEQ